MLDDATILLCRAGHEAGHIDKRQHRDIEGITETDKAGSLFRCINIQTTGQHHRLVGNHTHGRPFDADKTNHQVGCIVGLQLKKVTLVRHFYNQLFHVVGLIRVIGNQRIQRCFGSICRVFRWPDRWFLLIVGWQECDKTAQLDKGLHIIFKRQVRHAGFGRMGDCPSELLRGDRLMGHGFHYLGTGHKHIGAVFDHKNKVCDGGRIHRPTRTGTHDHGNLWNDTGRHDIALKHVGIATQGGHTLLNTCTTGIIQPYNRRTHFHGVVHQLTDFFCMGFRQGTTKNREVLAKYKHQPTIDGTVANDHTIAGNMLLFHAKIGTAMLDKHIPLLK